MPRNDCIFHIEPESDYKKYSSSQRCFEDEKHKSSNAANGRKGQLKRTNSSRIVSVIQKSPDLLDLVAVENSTSPKFVSNRLTTSRSCLALHEIAKLDGIPIDHNIMPNQNASETKHNKLTRKDSSGTESGFVEADTDLENEASKSIPVSFDSLPPLEQRRQKRIHELVQFVESFEIGFSNSIKKLQTATRANLTKLSSKSMETKILAMRKIDNLLEQLSFQVSKKKLAFVQNDSSNESQDFYIDAIGCLTVSYVDGILKSYQKLSHSDDVTHDENEGLSCNDVSLLYNDAIILLNEYFLRLQLCLKYVLYCTPRQHIDYRPLTDITDELNRLNRSNFDKATKDETAKDRSESLPLPVKVPTSVKNSAPFKDSTSTKTKSTVKRRHSCDNSTLRKLNSLTRGITLLRSSARRPKAGDEMGSLKKPTLIGSPNVTHTLKKSQSTVPWHSTPKGNPRMISSLKDREVMEDRETSFDSYRSNEDSRGQLSIGGKNGFYAERPGDEMRSNDNIAKNIRNIPRIEQVTSCVADNENDTVNDINRKTSFDHHRARELSNNSKKNYVLNRKFSYDTPVNHAVTNSGFKTAEKGSSHVDKRENTLPRKGRIFDAFYSRCIDEVSLHCRNKSSLCAENGTKIIDYSTTPIDSSPEFLHGSGPHSPTLLENDSSFFIMQPGCKGPAETMAKSTNAKLPLFNRKAKSFDETVKNCMHVSVAEESLECCTSDEDSRLDRSIGHVVTKKASKSTLLNHRSQSEDKSIGNARTFFNFKNMRKNKHCKVDKRLDQENSAIGHCDQTAVDLPPADMNGKKSSQNTREFPAIEDRIKGVKVTVSRVRKTFKDFTSPRIARKKEMNIKYTSFQEINAAGGKHTCSNNYEGDTSSKMNGRMASEVKAKCSKEEPTVGSGSQSQCRANYQSLAGNDVQNSKKLTNENIFNPNISYDDFYDPFIDGLDDENGLENYRCRSPSVASDLSISADFNSTVSKFLRSNTEGDRETKVGNSTFYLEANGVDEKLSTEKASQPRDSSPELLHTVPVLATASVIDDSSECSKEITRQSAQNVDPCKQLNADQSNRTEVALSSIRISKSEPLLKNTNNHSRLKANASFDTQKQSIDKLRKISKARISSWSKSLDNLLSDKDGVKVFSHFLKSEYSEENLLFWSACESFKSIRSTKIGKEAQRIYDTFIRSYAMCEVNLDHQTRTKIKVCLSSPCKEMFDQAQSKIRLLMAQDSYPRFIKSSIYEGLLQPA